MVLYPKMFNAKKTQSESEVWFIKKARTAAGYRRNIMANPSRSRDGVVIGKLFFFWYDPKHKDTLPIYDRFPMVFPIEPYNDGFLGLNLHYLNVGERRVILGQLKKYMNNTKYNKTTKLKLSYDLLASTKKLATTTRPCIKRYLFSHVESPFVEITADEWDKAIALPVQVFVYKR